MEGKELTHRVQLLGDIVTLFVSNYTRRGLLDADKLTVVSMMLFKILVRSGKVTADENLVLIRAPPDPNPPPIPDLAKTWLNETQWAQIKSLENLDAFKKGGKLMESMEQDSLCALHVSIGEWGSASLMDLPVPEVVFRIRVVWDVYVCAKLCASHPGGVLFRTHVLQLLRLLLGPGGVPA